MRSLALLLPGFLDSKDYAHLVDLDKKLKQIGYLTIRVNPTGTWDDNNIDKYSITQYLKDVEKTITKAKKNSKIDNILLAGHSLGGTIALLYGSRNTEVNTVVAIMSPSKYLRDENTEKIKKWEKEGFRKSTRDLPNDKKGEKEFNLPYSFIEDAKQYDVLEEISNFKGNLLLVTGKLDDCVKPKQLKDIYKEANEPKQLKFLENIGHDYRHNQDEIDLINNEIIQYLNETK